MQLKWLEDFVVLAQTGSFSRAAEFRHVTHPAFGRRIKALEAWAGTPLIERGSTPLALTAAGASLLDNAQQMVGNLKSAHHELLSAAGRQENTVTLATGRTLARTLVADLMLRFKPLLANGELRILTRSLTETSQLLERGEADFMVIYHHPLLAVQLSARQYTHTTLALGRLVQDHLANNPHAPHLRRVMECDSADAVYEYALKGLGVAWLPWSMVSGACKAGQLQVLGDAPLEVRFEVRAYRAKRRLHPLAERLWQVMEQR